MPEKIVWMSPDEVLKQMPALVTEWGESALISYKEFGFKYFSKPKIKALKGKYPTKQKLRKYIEKEKPVLLHYGSMWDVKGKKYPTHEGRHTTLLAKMLGIKKIPVVVRGK